MTASRCAAVTLVAGIVADRRGLRQRAARSRRAVDVDLDAPTRVDHHVHHARRRRSAGPTEWRDETARWKQLAPTPFSEGPTAVADDLAAIYRGGGHVGGRARSRSLEVRTGEPLVVVLRGDRRLRRRSPAATSRSRSRRSDEGWAVTAARVRDYCMQVDESHADAVRLSRRSGVPRPPVLRVRAGRAARGWRASRRRPRDGGTRPSIASCEIVTGPGATVQRYSTETDGVRPVLASRPVARRRRQLELGDLEVDLLVDLADHGVRRRLAGVDPAGDEAPPEVVGAVHQQDPAVVVEDRGVGADLRALVAELAREPCPHLRLGEVERLGVPAGRRCRAGGCSARGRRDRSSSADRSARSRAPRRAPSASRWRRR